MASVYCRNVLLINQCHMMTGAFSKALSIHNIFEWLQTQGNTFWSVAKKFIKWRMHQVVSVRFVSQERFLTCRSAQRRWCFSLSELLNTWVCQLNCLLSLSILSVGILKVSFKQTLLQCHMTSRDERISDTFTHFITVSPCKLQQVLNL